MIDLKELRTAPEVVIEAMVRRGDDKAEQLVHATLQADEERRRLIGEVELRKAERNAASKAIGAAKGRGEDSDA